MSPKAAAAIAAAVIVAAVVGDISFRGEILKKSMMIAPLSLSSQL